jgi:uncharacterized protein YndB with AHSA1/START domain
MADVTVTREIAAPPERVWALVSDMTRMGEWSPEATGGKWLGDATGPATGARFRGTNKAGWQRWSTTCRVIECVPGERFTFAVTIGPAKVATWSYDIEPTGDGCRVTESWTDDRSPFFAGVSKRATGVKDRAAHNRRNMERTLEALERAATR